ncbi:hypothetical protein THAOC_19505 [Thalassiosira oceanica]|uniref:Uncharacterized protein n=1 Tax=Thalassiosira oceanica TaxID=159749 RepID=K0S4P0_THAOC|nr:hypothetical protein THAOC_19505 [Thalassiosira oceanica]|eukprot:EJK60190.1 hypothetical protein THAOC_19505 [Thalassiosira oceanica]
MLLIKSPTQPLCSIDFEMLWYLHLGASGRAEGGLVGSQRASATRGTTCRVGECREERLSGEDNRASPRLADLRGSGLQARWRSSDSRPLLITTQSRQKTVTMTVTNRAKVLSIIPHVSGPLSVIGSGSIAYDILSDRKNKVKRPYYRIMLVMSIVDGLSSFALAFSTLPIPAGAEGVYGAAGTTQSCTTQGFFIQLMMISPLYNLILSTYYLLLGKYHMSEEEIARRYEKNMHVAAITIGVGFAILGLPLKLYNNANLWCWIATYPSNCETDSGEPGPVQCERGKHAWLFRWLIFYGPVWIAILCVVIIMIMLTRSVQSEEKKFVKLQDNMRRKGSSCDEEHKLDMNSPSRNHLEQDPYDASSSREEALSPCWCSIPYLDRFKVRHPRAHYRLASPGLTTNSR